MTDDAMRDLVARHDTTLVEYGSTIKNLVTSVEHLVTSQTETNKRLEEISKYLAKQAVFSSKLDNMDRELAESFKRVHKRIDEIADTQTNPQGCNSVRLLTKDVEAISKEMTRLIGVTEEHRIHLEQHQAIQSSYPSTGAIRWGIAILVAYSITFGTYVVQSLSTLDKTEMKITTILENVTDDVDKLNIFREHNLK